MSRQAATITYLGHMSFVWTTPAEKRILSDPVQDPEPGNSRWFLRDMPHTAADVAIVTHDHFDHNAVHHVTGTTQVVSDAETVSAPGATIRGVEDIHAPLRSGIVMPNFVFVIETGGVRYCHTGDNRAQLPSDALDRIGDVDVLILPVDDSQHVLGWTEVQSLIESIELRVVIPSHYFIDGLTHVDSTLLPITNWLHTQNRVRRVGNISAALNRDELPDLTEIWVLDAALAE